MGVRRIVATVLSSLALFACGGARHGEAKGPEADPWAGYQGTYATAAGAAGSPTTRIKAAQLAAKKDAPVEVAAPTPATAPSPAPAAPPAKKGKAVAAKAAVAKSAASKKAKTN
jgi:hypothetical protein